MSMGLCPASTAMKTSFPSKKTKKTNQTLYSFPLLFVHFWNEERTTNLLQSSLVSLFHLWSKHSPRHFAVNFTMCLRVSHFNHWAPPTEMIERVANEKLLYIFLQKKWRHITRFVPAFRRRFLSPFFLCRAEGAATRRLVNCNFEDNEFSDRVFNPAHGFLSALFCLVLWLI